MNVLHAIVHGQYIPTAPIYFHLTCRLPFNNTIILISNLQFKGMQSRLLFQQLGTDSHVIVEHNLNKVYLATSNFTKSVTFILLDAKRLTPEELPTLAYPPLWT